MMKGRGMLFKEFKQRALALLREAEGQGMLDVRGSIAKRRNELRAQFTQGLETGIERNRRILQLKRLGFYLLVNQWTTYCRTEEKWEQLFDEVEKITGAEAQKVLEEEEAEREEQVKRQKEQEQKQELVKQPQILTISERAVNFLFGQMKLKEEEGLLNARLMLMVDFLSAQVSKQCGFSKKGKAKELALFQDRSHFQDFVDSVKAEFNRSFVDFEFKASKVVEWFGYTSDQMSVNDVLEMFKSLEAIPFDIEGQPILFDMEKRGFVDVGQKAVIPGKRHRLFTLAWEKLGIISNRWKTNDILIKVGFGGGWELSWVFLANLSCKKWMTLPEKARHELDKYEQNLLREFRLWKHPGGNKGYNVLDLAKIAGLKDKEPYRLIQALTKMLKNLEAKKYIKGFTLEGKGKKCQFRIIK